MATSYSSQRIIFDAATQGDGAGTAQLHRGSFTATNATNKLTMTAHQLTTAAVFRLVGSDLPDGLVANKDYYAIINDANDFQAALSASDAVAGTAITFADDGSSTRSVTTLPVHNHPLYVNHITVTTKGTAGPVLVHDGLSGQILVDLGTTTLPTQTTVVTPIVSHVQAVYMTTLPADCKVIVELGNPRSRP